MIKKIWNFLCEYGNIVMIIGRFVIFICVILLLVNILNGKSVLSIPWSVIIVGVILYILGTIASQCQKRKKNVKDESDDL